MAKRKMIMLEIQPKIKPADTPLQEYQVWVGIPTEAAIIVERLGGHNGLFKYMPDLNILIIIYGFRFHKV